MSSIVPTAQDKKVTVFDVCPTKHINVLLYGNDPKFVAQMNALNQRSESTMNTLFAAIGGSGRNAD